MTRLQAEALETNKKHSFEALKPYLIADKDSAPYKKAADRLNMSEGAVRVAVHRMRKRYRELLREEIAGTVACDDQIDEEIRDLFTALGS